ncbi:MAG: YggS family pyridoxal phosphate-dependent enzyme [Oscillospiraceae bacterium]
MNPLHQIPQINYSYIVENYNRICYNIKDTTAKYRRPDDRVEIMAVTKTVSPDAVNIAVRSGIKLLGENRVQEFLSKKDLYNNNVEVHFIGKLQSNKVKYIINDVDMIQSVDSIKLACEIDRQAEKNSLVADILIEVNIGEEESKGGVSTESLDGLIYEAAQLKNIRICGLMAIPPINAEEKLFFEMQKLYNAYNEKNIENVNMSILSMGMSNDYQTAIKFGSTLVRIGTGLFGLRK